MPTRTRCEIARQASTKPRGLIVTRDRSYHGASYMAMALSGDSRTAHQVDAEAWGVRHVPPPYAYRCPFGSSETPTNAACAQPRAVGECIDAEGADRVAAVLMEADAGSNGIVAARQLLAGAAPRHARARASS